MTATTIKRMKFNDGHVFGIIYLGGTPKKWRWRHTYRLRPSGILLELKIKLWSSRQGFDKWLLLTKWSGQMFHVPVVTNMHQNRKSKNQMIVPIRSEIKALKHILLLLSLHLLRSSRCRRAACVKIEHYRTLTYKSIWGKGLHCNKDGGNVETFHMPISPVRQNFV